MTNTPNNFKVVLQVSYYEKKQTKILQNRASHIKEGTRIYKGKASCLEGLR